MTNTPTAELIYIDPNTLVLEDNARTNTERALTKRFVNSIRDHGVLHPILARRTSDGTTIVRDGQCRTLAAREANLDTVPVVVSDTTATDDEEATVERVTQQYVSNEQRTGLSNREKAAAIEQLRLAGVSATKIARTHLHISKTDVDAALSAAKSTTALDAMSTHDSLTLEQAATLASFDDDPEATELLTAAAADGTFDHVAQRLTDDRPARDALRTARAELSEQGYQVLTEQPILGRASTLQPLGSLYTADRERCTAEDIAALPAGCVHVYVTVYEIEEFWLDGTEVSEDDIDWSLQDEPTSSDATPEDGLHDPRKVELRVSVATEPIWYIDNPNDVGLYRYQDIPATDTDEHGEEDQSAAREAERVAAQREREAAEREERRRVRVLNKRAESAQQVRREKVRAALARKTLPKGKSATIQAFITDTLWHNWDLLGLSRKDADAQALATEFLGTAPAEAQDGVTAERAQMITLSVILGAHEANLPKTSWRNDPFEYARNHKTARISYLRFLVDVFDYQLSDIEEVITGEHAAESIPLD